MGLELEIGLKVKKKKRELKQTITHSFFVLFLYF
jgi:hypothetical protein